MNDPSEIFLKKGTESLEKGNTKEAEYFLKTASSQGDKKAMEIYVHHFSKGNDSTVKIYLEEIIEENPTKENLKKLGKLYTKENNFEKAFQYLKKAALLGNLKAQCLISSQFEKYLKYGLLKEIELADEMVKNAKYLSEYTFLMYLQQIPKYHEKGVQLLEENPDPMNNAILGAIYLYGITIQQDLKKSDLLFNELKLVSQELYRDTIEAYNRIKDKKCSYFPDSDPVQPYYVCITCDLTNENGKGICKSCFEQCHKDHNVVFYGFTPVVCDCFTKVTCSCQK